MPWKITCYPPIPGPHSLGPSMVLFGPDGTLTTDDEATATKALEFPDVFTVEDLSLVAAAQEEAPRLPDDVQPEAPDMPPDAPDTPPEVSARKRSHHRTED
jgi:hypothetical protein